MRQYPKPLNRLINEFSKLPGIGGKTAQRLAFHVLSLSTPEVESLANAIRDAKQNLRYCSVCGNLTDQDPCSICSDPQRDPKVICVVESPQDVLAMERIREFNGRYHVLHGTISPVEGIGPGDINLKSLSAEAIRNSGDANCPRHSGGRRPGVCRRSHLAEGDGRPSGDLIDSSANAFYGNR